MLIDIILKLVVALDGRIGQWRAGGLLGNEDGDMSGAQQLALTAVGIAIIVGFLYPLLSGGMSTVVSNMLSRLQGV